MRIQIHPHLIRLPSGRWMERYDGRLKGTDNISGAKVVKSMASAQLMATHLGAEIVELSVPVFVSPETQTFGDLCAFQ